MTTPQKTSANRVVITGLGSLCALGLDTPTFWKNAQNAQCGIGPLANMETEGLTSAIGAEVSGYRSKDYFSTKEVKRMDRYTEFGVIAAREAIADAGLNTTHSDKNQWLVIIGSGIGGEVARDEASQRLYRHKIPRAHPFTVPRIMPSAVASLISMDQGIQGPTFVVSSACSSSNHAILQGAMMIRCGQADVALVGGAEACLTYGDLLAWEALSVLDPQTSRPFSLNRKGIVLGEGAGILILESLEHAKARKANIYAEIAGGSMTADAQDLLHPSEAQIAKTLTTALRNSKINPEQVSYVNAHGSGTPTNDVTETRALHQAFGTHAPKLAISSTKSMHGHAIGATGALELILTSLAIRDSILPPTVNFEAPDPECNLNYLPNEARSQAIDVAISSSFAFGGLNAVVVLKKFAGS